MNNRFWLLIRMVEAGFYDAVELRLNQFTNWTPLLVYIHVTRLIIGVCFGFIIGFWVGGLVWGLFLAGR